MIDLISAAFLAVKATLILGAALIVIRILTRANPRWRMFICETTAVAVLFLPVIAMLPITIAISLKGVPNPVATTFETSEAGGPAVVSMETGGFESAGESFAGPSKPQPVFANSFWESGFSGMALWMVYGVGICFFVARYWISGARLKKSIAQFGHPDSRTRAVFERVAGEFHLTTPPALRVTKGEISPFCCGKGGGTIVIPESLTAPGQSGTLAMVLRHELHHLSHRDLRRNAFMSFVAVIFWVHPLIWVLRHCHNVAIEELGDRIAADDETGRGRYRSMLADLALRLHQMRTPYPVALGIFRTPQIVGRLRRLRFAVSHESLSLRSKLSFTVPFFIPLILTVAALRITGAEAETFVYRYSGADSEQIEKSLSAALEALLGVQSEDGSFRRDDGSSSGQETGITSLAGMAFLAHGGADENSSWHAPLKKCLDYVIECQGESGAFLSSPNGKRGVLYEHFIATWFLASMQDHAGEKRSARIRKMLARAVKVIVDAQAIPKVANAQGGWRYAPHSTDSDISCTCWAIRALYAARKAGVDFPDQVLDDAIAYVLRLQNADGGFGYTSVGPGGGSNVARTAMALYCLQAAGKGESEEAAKAAVYLLAEHEKPQKAYEFYAILWGAAAFSRRGGEGAETYASWMVKHCKSRQADGRWKGSLGDNIGTIFVLHAYVPPD